MDSGRRSNSASVRRWPWWSAGAGGRTGARRSGSLRPRAGGAGRSRARRDAQRWAADDRHRPGDHRRGRQRLDGRGSGWRLRAVARRGLGTGLDAEAAAHVFEPFYIDPSRDAEDGFGLASVYGLVKQSQGFVWSARQNGAGRWHACRGPAPGRRAGDAAVADRRGRDAPPAPAPAGPPRVLVVEDESSVREFLTTPSRGTDSRCSRRHRRRGDGGAAGVLRPAADGHQPARDGLGWSWPSTCDTGARHQGPADVRLCARRVSDAGRRSSLHRQAIHVPRNRRRLRAILADPPWRIRPRPAELAVGVDTSRAGASRLAARRRVRRPARPQLSKVRTSRVRVGGAGAAALILQAFAAGGPGTSAPRRAFFLGWCAGLGLLRRHALLDRATSWRSSAISRPAALLGMVLWPGISRCIRRWAWPPSARVSASSGIAALALAARGVGGDRVHARAALGGFPWVPLGNSQVEVLPIAQLASVLGVYGLSAFVAIVNALVVGACHGGPAAHGAGRGAVCAGGRRRHLGRAAHCGRQLSSQGDVFRVGLVQANIAQADKWDPAPGPPDPDDVYRHDARRGGARCALRHLAGVVHTAARSKRTPPRANCCATWRER